MAVGDLVGKVQSIGTASFLEIKPSSGEEWIIHNVYSEGEATIKAVEGATEVEVDNIGAAGNWLGYWFHISSTHYYKVYNDGTAAVLMGYDGIVSKST